MDYRRAYKSFINSQYLSEGVRMTAGILFPAFLMSYYNLLDLGIVVSLGALCVAITDNPGPIHHRKNGMLACIAAICIMATITGFIATYTFIFGVFIVLATFFFAMISLYGARAGSIGIAALLVTVLNLQLGEKSGVEVLEHALFMTSGGAWYMSFSLLLYNVRPYRLPQQALGDCIQSIAEYLRNRSELYSRNVSYYRTYKKLLQLQAVVQEKQNLVNELLFKTRIIVKETSKPGRFLVLIYHEITDMFESIMTAYHRYSVLHRYFDDSDILDDFKQVILQMADELEDIGVSVKSGEYSAPTNLLQEKLQAAEKKLEDLRTERLSAENIDGFISLRRILNNMQDLVERLNILHSYTSYDSTLRTGRKREIDLDKMITSQKVEPSLFVSNLTLTSDIFRHSIRISLAMLAGYLVSIFFPLGHSYWILLTIIVIMKPAYSLTQKRNKDRLIGTVLGVVAGLLFVLYIDDHNILLGLMIVLMAASFSFMRSNYFMSVLLMTPYIIIFFHLLHPQNFRGVLWDRIIDTAIGSAIAFTASIFIFPLWERNKMKQLMIDMLQKASHYFEVVAATVSSDQPLAEKQKLARKDTMVALANLSDAFNRMLSEPKMQQKNIDQINQFVVMSHMLTSYIASLAHYDRLPALSNQAAELQQVIEDVKQHLKNAIEQIENPTSATSTNALQAEPLKVLSEQADKLVKQRQQELKQGLWETPTRTKLFNLKSVVDQFTLIYKIAGDINKTVKDLKWEGDKIETAKA